MRATDPERRAREDRKRNPVARSSVPVDRERHEDDRVTEQHGEKALPPVEPCRDHPRAEHVGGDANAHPDPERRDVPDVPRAPFARNGGEIGVREGGHGRRKTEC